MSLFIFVRFHARASREGDLGQALVSILEPTRAESGCRSVHLFRSVRDPGLYFIHSEWKTAEDFDAHASLPHMQVFLARVPDLIDHPLDVIRTEKLS
jgi:quinol monooxygenase YgiN